MKKENFQDEQEIDKFIKFENFGRGKIIGE